MWSRSKDAVGGRTPPATTSKRRSGADGDDDGGGDDALLRDAMRLELESRQRRFFAKSFGDSHPLVKLQAVKTAHARTRLAIREGRRTARDVSSAVAVNRRAEATGVASWGRSVSRQVDEFVEAIAEMRDEMEDFREAFTSSERGEEEA